MRLRNWLLTGTSVGLFALAPTTLVQAQSGAVIGAYQEFIAASSSGDADATAAAEAAFTAQCAAEGFGGAQECIDAINNPAAAAEPEAPVEEVAPEAPVEEVVPEAPVEELAPEAPVEELAPAEEVAPEPAVEEPAPEPEPVVEEPAPEPEAAPAPVVEEPAPAEEPAVQPEAPVEQPAAPVEEQAAPVEEAPVPAEQQAVPVEEAPVPQEQSQPTEEAPVPAEQQAPVEEVTPAEQPTADIGGALTAEVDTYNAAVADLLSGGDPQAGQDAIAASEGRLAQICANGGYASLDECLAAYGLTLPAVPGIEAPATDAALPPPDANAVDAPVDGVSGQLLESVETLPEGVTQEQLAPVLDSAKDVETETQAGDAPVAQEPVSEEPAPPPPESDAQAQQAIAPEQIVSAQEAQGEALEAAPVAELPPNVTIINNTTNVNNTVVNNETNNTTINNGDSTTNNVDVNVQNTQVIFQVGTQISIRNPAQDRDRFTRDEDEVYYEQLDRGRTRETIERADGTRIVTIRNRNGDILQRSRITPDNQEFVLAYFDEENDEDLLNFVDPGDELPPLRLNISVNEYVLDAEDADEEEVELFFRQPPVEEVRRLYSIDEVKRSARIRDTVRRLEIGGLTFDTGAATISRDQVGALSTVAAAMQGLLESNPAETFLIEGHTDAVGSEISNLSLSDLRASTVARILTDFYDIPPENLETQGYGERYLKIRTEADERENRRVTVRRITTLVTPVASN